MSGCQRIIGILHYTISAEGLNKVLVQLTQLSTTIQGTVLIDLKGKLSD